MLHKQTNSRKISEAKTFRKNVTAHTKKFVFVVLLLSLTVPLLSADEAEPAFGIRFSGFVKTDAIWDSRQTVALREGHFLLYPSGEKMDQNGDDINAKANFNILAIQTRLKGVITGPDAFGAKTSGFIEASFFGTTDNDGNGFRLRHAILTLDWPHSSLMIGQFWHPMFVTSVFPGTLSFNTGAPFQPFSRNPQIRWTYKAGNARLIAAAIAQRDFASAGPNGTTSTYLRNTSIPNMHVQLQWATNKMILGLGGDWKALTPRLETTAGYKTTKTVSSTAALAYARFNFPTFAWKFEGVYGQNLTDHLMLGGYGVESVEAQTAIETYIPTTVFSVWTDLETGKEFGLGLFAGLTQNLGAANDIQTFWGRGGDIEKIYRLAPRFLWNSAKTQLAAEVEYTAASYGTIMPDATVKDGKLVGNVRLLLAAFYFF